MPMWTIPLTYGGKILAAANLDDDDAKEVICAWFGTVYLLDDMNSDFAVINSKDFTLNGSMLDSLNVAAGDFDGDGKSEFVVVQNSMSATVPMAANSRVLVVFKFRLSC